MAKSPRHRANRRVREAAPARYAPDTPEALTGVLLDSDVVIEILRGRSRIVDAAIDLERTGTPTYCTAISWAEIYAGIRAGEEPLTEAFFLDVGEPTCDSVSATDLPQTVSIVQTAVSQLQGPAREVSGVRVTVNVQHGYIGELLMVLTSPSGTDVVLHNETGGSANNIVGTYPVDLVPAESLDVLEGEDAEGTWTLTVSDSVLMNTGSLEAWTLEFCGYPSDPTVPETSASPPPAAVSLPARNIFEYRATLEGPGDTALPVSSAEAGQIPPSAPMPRSAPAPVRVVGLVRLAAAVKVALSIDDHVVVLAPGETAAGGGTECGPPAGDRSRVASRPPVGESDHAAHGGAGGDAAVALETDDLDADHLARVDLGLRLLCPGGGCAEGQDHYQCGSLESC